MGQDASTGGGGRLFVEWGISPGRSSNAASMVCSWSGPSADRRRIGHAQDSTVSITEESTMRDVFVAGVGMTVFGKHADRTLRSLTEEAVAEALADAGAS